MFLLQHDGKKGIKEAVEGSTETEFKNQDSNVRTST